MLPIIVPETSLPAVSALNGKIAAYGGWVQSNNNIDGGLFALSGAVTIPVGHQFGVQVDGLASSLDGNFAGRLAGHFFWRDPNRGLIGAYAAVDSLDSADSWRIAASAEAYLNNISLWGRLGYEDYQANGFPDDDGVYALAEIGYYANENLLLSGGYKRVNATNMGFANIEYQLANSWIGDGTSLFVEGALGDNDYGAIWGGIRIYVGAGPKSLIRRHREDDPREDKRQIDGAKKVDPPKPPPPVRPPPCPDCLPVNPS